MVKPKDEEINTKNRFSLLIYKVRLDRSSKKRAAQSRPKLAKHCGSSPGALVNNRKSVGTVRLG
jgi:hypothetical protein